MNTTLDTMTTSELYEAYLATKTQLDKTYSVDLEMYLDEIYEVYSARMGWAK